MSDIIVTAIRPQDRARWTELWCGYLDFYQTELAPEIYDHTWARLIAVNANTGDIAWQITLGTTEELPEGRRNTGRSGSAGPTVTAGGLVFIGAADDRRFRAFDSKTGTELWSAKLDGAGNANPIVYQGRNGKQYVAIVAASSVVVFALP